MRFTSGLFALLVATALILAGCLQVPEEENETTPEGDDDFEGDQDGDGPPADDDSGGDGGDGGDGGSSDNQTGGNNTPSPEPDCVSPPAEQEVDSEDDIECAGQYTITNEGSGETWNVPTWEVDDWWKYETTVEAAGDTSCFREEITVLDDSKTSSGVPIYTIEIQVLDCEEEESENDPREENRTQGSLMALRDDGYVDHQAVFPFKDGKSWTHMMKNDNLVDVGPIEYDDSYNHDSDPLTSVKAWIVEWEMGDNGQVQFTHTWAPDIKNTLKETMHVSSGGFTVEMEKELLGSNYELQEDDPLPGVPLYP